MELTKFRPLHEALRCLLKSSFRATNCTQRLYCTQFEYERKLFCKHLQTFLLAVGIFIFISKSPSCFLKENCSCNQHKNKTKSYCGRRSCQIQDRNVVIMIGLLCVFSNTSYLV